MTRYVLTVLLFSALLPSVAQNSSQGPLVPTAHTTPTMYRVSRYGKFEAAFRLPDATGNPFDPAVNDVQVTFHGPAGTTVRIPAFWDGEGVWKVRYAPLRVGAYTLAVSRNGQAERPQGLTSDRFTCVAGTRPGFVRVDTRHRQRFVFDNGGTYYPFGCDQAWTSGGRSDYPGMFQKMGANGMNWARVWTTFWDGKALEWSPDKAKDPPIGQFLLPAARRWDMVMDAAEKNGVYVQMCLQHHGQYTNRTDPNWRDNPYNAANGGFLAQPQDFFTDPRAIALTKAKFRYTVARWGYSDHLLAWELFNEVQNIGEANAHFENVVAWHRTMAAYLRQIDPYHHLVTSSNTPPGEALEKGVAFDYDQYHSYVPDVVSLFGTFDASKLTRPLFWGEWGHSGGNWGSDSQSQAFLHDGLWSGVMTPLAGAPQFWYWDQIEGRNWWPLYKAVSGYLRASRVTAQTDLHRVTPKIQTTGRGDLSFAPPLGWGATRTYAVTPSSEDGSLPGLDGVSTSIQGQNHREMTREPVVFHLNSPQAGQFVLRFGEIARAGAHPVLRLDGQVAAEKDYPAADADHRDPGAMLIVDVPAGRHAVSVWNTGQDWFMVEKITLTNYVPALSVLAKGNARSVFFWSYAQTRPYGEGAPAAQALSGTLRFVGLTPGRYALTLWDTVAGKPLGGPRMVQPVGGTIAVAVPPVQNDFAGWMEKR